jgi:hypothetical protein
VVKRETLQGTVGQKATNLCCKLLRELWRKINFSKKSHVDFSQKVWEQEYEKVQNYIKFKKSSQKKNLYSYQTHNNL